MNNKNNSKDIFNINDTLDINELASLNDDISTEFIEQLQNQVAQNASEFTGRSIDELNDDSSLFEEVQNQKSQPTTRINIDENIDDNFIKKYKAKLNKQQQKIATQTEEEKKAQAVAPNEKEKEKAVEETNLQIETPDINIEQPATIESIIDNTVKEITIKEQPKKTTDREKNAVQEEIKELSGGNIIETPAKKEQLEYNEMLDLADNNIKYSKYVIYIDPENKEFMDSLTVKERKNLVNRIIREQDDIAITKHRLNIIKTVIKHTIIAIITIAIAIPISYWIINVSLEATIDNYKRSKTAFKTLYREKGKIKTNSSH